MYSIFLFKIPVQFQVISKLQSHIVIVVTQLPTKTKLLMASVGNICPTVNHENEEMSKGLRLKNSGCQY